MCVPVYSEAWQVTDTGSGAIITHSSGVDLSASEVEGKFRLETKLDRAVKWSFEPTTGGKVLLIFCLLPSIMHLCDESFLLHHSIPSQVHGVH
jgi:hypothetical protein